MLSDVTLQFHISYFSQDNDYGRHCHGTISDNRRHLGGDEKKFMGRFYWSELDLFCTLSLSKLLEILCQQCWELETFTHPDKLLAVKEFTGLVLFIPAQHIHSNISSQQVFVTHTVIPEPLLGMP